MFTHVSTFFFSFEQKLVHFFVSTYREYDNKYNSFNLCNRSLVVKNFYHSLSFRIGIVEGCGVVVVCVALCVNDNE